MQVKELIKVLKTLPGESCVIVRWGASQQNVSKTEIATHTYNQETEGGEVCLTATEVKDHKTVWHFKADQLKKLKYPTLRLVTWDGK